MKSTVVRKHLQPMVLSIVIGSILGICLAIPALITTGYVTHRMYYFMACMLVASINFWVLTACIVLYAMHIGIMLKGWIRYPLFAFAGIAVIYTANRRFDLLSQLRYIFRDVNAEFIKAMFSQGILHIIAAIIVIVFGVILLRRSRVQESIEVDPEPNPIIASTVPHRTELLKSSPYLSAIIITSFIGLNILPTLLQLKNTHDTGKSPNIIYIIVDTLRADHLGCYGYSRNTSPNIDKFAGQSMRFETAISQAPWTTASFASFMSARYLHDGMTFSSVAIPSNVVIMPELLKSRGYVTAAVISNSMAGIGTGLERGYDHYFEMPTNEVNTVRGKYAIPTTVVTKSIEVLRQMKNQRFFLCAHFMGPHSPYASHKGYDFFPGYKGKLSREGIFVEGGARLTGDDLKYAKALYDGEIAYTDQYIGLMIAELKKLNLYDDTLIVLLADHGEEFNEHGKMSHGEHLYDESISVPLIIKLPGQTKGSVVQGAFPLINLMPSITSYIHCDTSALEFQGTAVPLGGLQRVRQTNIYSGTTFNNAKLQSLRSDSNKLIVDVLSDSVELYDLKKDPGEKQNITSDIPETASALQSELHRMNSDIDAALKHTVSKRLTAAESQANRDTKRALGYLQ